MTGKTIKNFYQCLTKCKKLIQPEAILESKDMLEIFFKTGQDKDKNSLKGKKWAKYLKIWAKNVECFEKRQVIACDYYTQ